MRLLKLELKRVLITRLTWVLLLAALVMSLLMAYLPTTFSYVEIMDENGNTTTLQGLDSIRYLKNVQSATAGEVTSQAIQEALENYQECLRK